MLYGVEVWGNTISLNAWNEIEKIQKMFLRRQLGVKSTTTYQVMILETNVLTIEILMLQRAYRYITKVKNIPNHSYHILLGMFDVNYKRITRAKLSRLVG